MTCKRLGLVAIVASLMMSGGSPAWAQTAPSLGAAQSFAVLGGSAVTNTGPSVITGDLGVSPGSAVTGFPPGIVVPPGTIHADAVSLAAQNSVTTAYNALTSQPCNTDLTGQDLGGLTLIPGVYCFTSSAQLTGTLVLNAQGNPNAVFVFKIGSTLVTASNALVIVNNGGLACNVFWQVGSSATLGTGSTVVGNILALTSITMTTSARLTGRALARNGAVTLDSNTATAAACGGITPPPGCATITVSPATLPNGTISVPFSQTITASGGTGPSTFSVSAGSLPPGLTLSAAGLLSGTPTASGVFSFTIRATDTTACFGELAYTQAIAAAVPTLPQIFLVVLALGLGAAGYLRLRRLSRAGRR